jgi:hypothetical protein
LSGTENGYISISEITEPYGKNSKAVVSIGVFLSEKNEEPDWKVHIPHENLDELSNVLKEISQKN